MGSRASKPPHADFGEQLKKRLEDRLLERDRLPARPSLSTIARELQIKEVTLRSWCSGRALPGIEKLRNIADFLFEVDDLEKRDEFTSEIRSAMGQAEAKSRIADQSQSVRISYVDFPPFTGSREAPGFLDWLIRDLCLRESHISFSEVPGPDARFDNIDSLIDQLTKDKTDIIIGPLATLDRTLHYDIVGFTPVVISVAALCPANQLQRYLTPESGLSAEAKRKATEVKLEALRTLISGGNTRARLSSKVRFVTCRKEVGWVFAQFESQSALEMTSSQGTSNASLIQDEVIQSFDIESIEDAFNRLELLDSNSGNADCLSVLLIDEISALSLIKKSTKLVLLPVIPLSTHKATLEHQFRRQLPGFSLGIGVSKRKPWLANFLTHAMKTILLHETYRVAERYVELSNSIKQLVLNAYDSLSERIFADFPLTLVDLFEEPTQVEQKYLTDHAVSPNHKVLIQTIANRWSRDVLRLRKSQIRSYDSDLPWRLVLDLAHSQLAKNLLGSNKTDDESNPSEDEQWIKDLIAQSCRTFGNLAQKRVWSALHEALDLPVGESNLYVPILGDPTQFYYEKVRSLLGGEDSSLHRKKDLDFELLEFEETTFQSTTQKACFKMLTEMSIYTDEKSEAQRLINLLLCGDNRKDASQHWQFLLLPHYPNKESLRDQCGFNWLSVENGGRCKLEASFIRPAWRGFGIGKKLLLATIDAAKKLGAKQIYKPASECGPDLASLLSLLDFTIELDPTSKSTQFRLELSS